LDVPRSCAAPGKQNEERERRHIWKMIWQASVMKFCAARRKQILGTSNRELL